VFTNSFLSRWWSIATHMNEAWHLHEGVVLHAWIHWRRLGICFEFQQGITQTFCGWKSTFEICLHYIIVLRLTCDFGIARRRETPPHARPHCVGVFHDRTSHVFEERCIHAFKRLSCCASCGNTLARTESWAGVVRCASSRISVDNVVLSLCFSQQQRELDNSTSVLGWMTIGDLSTPFATLSQAATSIVGRPSALSPTDMAVEKDC